MIFPLYKGKGEMNVRIIEVLAFLSMVGKIYAGILIDKVHRVTGGLIDDE